MSTNNDEDENDDIDIDNLKESDLIALIKAHKKYLLLLKQE